MRVLKVNGRRFVKMCALTILGASVIVFSHYKINVTSYLMKSYAMEDNITVVTMFIDIGTFKKGSGARYYTNETYLNWMRSWTKIKNPVVAFFENETMIAKFREIRSCFPVEKTVIVKFDRSQLHAFSHYEKIKEIYATPKYPQHHPNTVNANYSCAMSAKYDVIEMALDMGLVDTEYLTWVDFGYFRHVLQPGKNETFRLGVPTNFNSSRVGFSQVKNRDKLKSLKPWEFIQNNQVWVAGGFVLANQEVIRSFIKAYRTAVDELLKANMMSTDQQVIGAMYSPDMVKSQEVDVMTYLCSNGMFGLRGGDVLYFCLGYTCQEAGERNERNETDTNA